MKKRPFVCNMCGKAFRSKRNLKAHYMKIHDIDIDKLRKERPQEENAIGNTP